MHPRHGAVTVNAYEQRSLGGEQTEVVVLESSAHSLIVRVPAGKLEEVGIRTVMDQDGVNAVMAVLGEETTEEPANWSRRFKMNEQKLASGEITQVAEIVRDISRRDADRAVSPGEKKILEKARQNLLGELALVPGIGGIDAANALVDNAIGIAAAE